MPTMVKCLLHAQIARPLLGARYFKGVSASPSCWQAKTVGRGRSMGYLLDFGKNPWSTLAKKLVRETTKSSLAFFFRFVALPLTYPRLFVYLT
jgi:hypothetical protein